MVGIYKITNNINGKVYIGRSIDVKKRIQMHLNRNYDNYNYVHGDLDRDIAKYGKENFSWTILCLCKKEELDRFEEFYIALFGSCNSETGYNKKTFDTVPSNNQERAVIDIDTKEVFSGTSECARQLSISQGDITRVCNRLSGSISGRRFMYLDEYTEKGIIEYIPIENHKKCKQVKCLETNEIFESAHDAGRKLNLNFRLISSVCNNKRKTTGGYHFIYI